MSTWPSDDPAAERHWGFGSRGPVSASTEFNEETAYTYSPYWAGVQIYANTIASLPLPTYERLAAGGKKDAPDHPLYDLLDTLGTLIQVYDEEHYSIPEESGSGVLRFLMDEHGINQSDLINNCVIIFHQTGFYRKV